MIEERGVQRRGGAGGGRGVPGVHTGESRKQEEGVAKG